MRFISRLVSLFRMPEYEDVSIDGSAVFPFVLEKEEILIKEQTMKN